MKETSRVERTLYAVGTKEIPGAIWIPRKYKLSSKVWSLSVRWIKKKKEGTYLMRD